MLIDRRDLNAGASGGNHGLLHSGGALRLDRPGSGIECRQENAILKRLAPQCIETDRRPVRRRRRRRAGLREQLSAAVRAGRHRLRGAELREARTLEPQLRDTLFAAYRVPDATIDPFHLALEHVDHARSAQRQRLPARTPRCSSFEIADGEIRAAICRDNRSGARSRIRAASIVNAGGAWSMKIARLAGCADVDLLLARARFWFSHDRIAHHVINRLRPPGDGDILVPGGTVSLLGTTSTRTRRSGTRRTNRRRSRPQPPRGRRRCCRCWPGPATSARFSRVRPLLQAAGGASDRAASAAASRCSTTRRRAWPTSAPSPAASSRPSG